jgi:hypothetical protein
MTTSQRANIQKLAERIRQVLFPEDPVFPVDPVSVIGRLGGELEYTDLEKEVYAEIHRTPTGFKVELAIGQSPTRERFTLAHELGHLFLHMGYLEPDVWSKSSPYFDGAFRRTEGDYRQEELEANEFAASFLMPAEHFKHVAEEHFDPVTSSFHIPAIANYFGVSREAAVYRGRWLRLFSWE